MHCIHNVRHIMGINNKNIGIPVKDIHLKKIG